MITLGVTDLQTSTDFYVNKFGWTKYPASNENITFFKLSGILLSLFHKDALAKDADVESFGPDSAAFGISYNTRSEAEVDELIESLGNKGVKIIKAPHKTDWGGYSAYIADPDDHLWEIAYNPYLQLDKDGNVAE